MKKLKETIERMRRFKSLVRYSSATIAIGLLVYGLLKGIELYPLADLVLALYFIFATIVAETRDERIWSILSVSYTHLTLPTTPYV